MYSIFPIPAFQDNYIWAITNQETGAVIVVDPGDAAPVLEHLQQRRFSLVGILITHHHMDHTGGVKKLQQEYDVPVYGGIHSKYPGVTKALKENDEFDMMGLSFKVLEVPGHTLDHIAYFIDDGLTTPALFCGDTLFSGGCGRLFEGTPAQMNESLSKLSSLPANTEVYCTHEYTLSNLAFARSVMPNNTALIDYSVRCEHLREQGKPTLPSNLKTESEINPFLRCDDPEVIAQAKARNAALIPDSVNVFAEIRKWKDCF